MKMCFDYYEDSKSDDKGAYLESLKNKLKDVEGKLKNFAKAIGAGILNETTHQAMSELENQKHLLKEQIEAEGLREYVLDIFVDRIYVYKGKIIITFHFIDDKQELSFEDTLEMIENFP